jgi:hypothetical protein
MPPLRGRMTRLFESMQIEMERIQVAHEVGDLSFLDPLADVTWEMKKFRFDATVHAVTHRTNLMNMTGVRSVCNNLKKEIWKFRKPSGVISMPHLDNTRLTTRMLGFVYDLLRCIVRGMMEESIRNVQTMFPTQVDCIEHLKKELNNEALTDYVKTQTWIWDNLEKWRMETPDKFHNFTRLSEPEKDEFCRGLLMSMVCNTTTNEAFITDATCPEILQLDLPTITSWWWVMKDVSDMASILHCTLHFMEINGVVMDEETFVFMRDTILQLQGMDKYSMIKKFKDLMFVTPGSGAALHQFLVENTTQRNCFGRWGVAVPVLQMKLGSFSTDACSNVWKTFIDFTQQSYTMQMHENMEQVAKQVAVVYLPTCRKIVGSFVEGIIDNSIRAFTLGTHTTSGNTFIQSLDGGILSIILEQLGGQALSGADVVSM